MIQDTGRHQIKGKARKAGAKRRDEAAAEQRQKIKRH
jgi:hypothetical protein